MTPVFVIIGVLLLGLLVRLAAGAWDRERIERYVRDHGGEIESIEWAPFGRGWFGEQSDRIYRVRYVDREGNGHEASCKTSLFTGVYFTEDGVVRPVQEPRRVQPSDDVAALRDENERLRDELRRMRGS